MTNIADEWVMIRVLALWMTLQVDLTSSFACDWYPSSDYMDISLKCSGMRVTGPPQSLPDSLQTLQLLGSSLTTLSSATFEGRHLPHLSSLVVSGGILTSVQPLALCSLPSLNLLDLTNNYLVELAASSFQRNGNLRRVTLSGNRSLKRLPALVSDSIHTLYAVDCGLSDVEPNTLRGLTKLRRLHLDGNPRLDCSSVKQRLARAFPSLTVICGEDVGGDSHSNMPEVSGNKLTKQVTETSTWADVDNVPQGKDLLPSTYDTDSKANVAAKPLTESKHVSPSTNKQAGLGENIQTNAKEFQSVMTDSSALKAGYYPKLEVTDKVGLRAAGHIIKKVMSTGGNSSTFTDLDNYFVVCMAGICSVIVVLSGITCYLKANPPV